MADQLVLWWIKKDFRLADNPALHAALRSAGTVLPVFVFEPALLKADVAEVLGRGCRGVAERVAVNDRLERARPLA
ncbi:MAG: deoxyribodipyrimidine photo-lyase [Phycisphaeraceae bacterium]|nr:deoxyribodipyrimidine photo-lyase [Phycisphaeraceae bacterium]